MIRKKTGTIVSERGIKALNFKTGGKTPVFFIAVSGLSLFFLMKIAEIH